jgi:outer membrane protein TolC
MAYRLYVGVWIMIRYLYRSHRRTPVAGTIALALLACIPARGFAAETGAADSLAAAFAAEAPPLPESPTLDDYLAAAARRSPAMLAAFERWRAKRERAGYQGALPDPLLSYTYFVESVETRVGPQNQRFALRQMVPWFGTLGAKGDVSAEAAEAEREAFEARRLEVFYRVKTAYYDYYYLGRAAAITRENLELLTFWESVARAKYRVGLKQHPDVIRAQLELGKLEDRLLSVEQEREPAAARLRAAIGLEPGEALPVPDSIVVAETEVDRDSVVARTMRRNPDLQSLAYRISSERAGVRLAGKSSWPDLMLGVDYIDTGPAAAPGVPDSGKDPVMVSVGVSVPLWFGANAARKREAEARLRAAQHNYTDATRQLDAMLERVLFEYRDSLRKTRLYRDGLIPKAQQSLGANYTAYQAGETDFLSVLDAQRQLLAFQLEFERSRTNLAKRRAEIEMLTGTEMGGHNE